MALLRGRAGRRNGRTDGGIAGGRAALPRRIQPDERIASWITSNDFTGSLAGLPEAGWLQEGRGFRARPSGTRSGVLVPGIARAPEAFAQQYPRNGGGRHFALNYCQLTDKRSHFKGMNVPAARGFSGDGQMVAISGDRARTVLADLGGAIGLAPTGSAKRWCPPSSPGKEMPAPLACRPRRAGGQRRGLQLRRLQALLFASAACRRRGGRSPIKATSIPWLPRRVPSRR